MSPLNRNKTNRRLSEIKEKVKALYWSQTQHTVKLVSAFKPSQRSSGQRSTLGPTLDSEPVPRSRVPKEDRPTYIF